MYEGRNNLEQKEKNPHAVTLGKLGGQKKKNKGWKAKAAAKELGKLGGQSKSIPKVVASRANGKLGGRPPKNP